VRWNDKSGAEGEAVRGMPLLFVRADRETNALIPLDTGQTDEKGRFSFIGDAEIKTSVLGKMEGARNIPAQVVAELNRKNRSAQEQTLIDALDAIQQRVNTETAWGRKINEWMSVQNTTIHVDNNSPVPARYDPAADRIVVNPQRALSREQLLSELKRGYLHNQILLFHEELHRAQNSRSGKRYANPQMALLREIHAYWISHLLDVESLYQHLYENPHSGYTDLFRVDIERFGRLCGMMDWGYAYFDGDFDRLAAYVGEAESLAAFEDGTQQRIDQTADRRAFFEERGDALWDAKREWREMVGRLAREVLGE
jgi:hypothetical protein